MTERANYQRNYHIELINEHTQRILNREFSDATKDIAVEIATIDLAKIQTIRKVIEVSPQSTCFPEGKKTGELRE